MVVGKKQSVPSSQENSTIRNSAIERTRTFRASEKEEEEKEKKKKKKKKEEESSSSEAKTEESDGSPRESAAVTEDNENNAAITLKGEIQGRCNHNLDTVNNRTTWKRS